MLRGPLTRGLAVLLGNEATKETGGVHLIPVGVGGCHSSALIYLWRRFIRTALTAAGAFVLLILAIKHVCRGLSRPGVGGGVGL